MSADPVLFDLPAAQHAATHGQHLAETAERVHAWHDRALAALDALAAAGAPFTADDLVERVGLPDTGTNRNNAVGALFAGASRRGVITRAGYRSSTRVSGHGRIVAVWVGAWVRS